MTFDVSPDEGALMERAHYLEVAGKEEEALAIINRILFTNPDNAEAGRAFARLKQAVDVKDVQDKPKREKPKVEDKAIVVAEKAPPPEPAPASSEMQQLLEQNNQLIKMLQTQRTQPREKQPAPPPSVRITNQQVAYETSQKSKQEKEDDVNMAAGCIGGMFALVGIFGISHLINGKAGHGLLFLLICTPIYWVIGGVIYSSISVATLGIGAICAIIIHLFVAMAVTSDGAS